MTSSTPEPGAVLALPAKDFLWFVDQALDAMVAIVAGLGDIDANRRPELPGANSPYVILTHCLGVMEYWGGHVVAGRAIERDRDAEFRAGGPVDDLIRRTADARRRLERDMSLCQPLAPPRQAPPVEDADLPLAKTQGAVLLHLYEELAQHLGQMELSRDVLRAAK